MQKKEKNETINTLQTLHIALQHGVLNVEFITGSRAEFIEDKHPVLEG